MSDLTDLTLYVHDGEDIGELLDRAADISYPKSLHGNRKLSLVQVMFSAIERNRLSVEDFFRNIEGRFMTAKVRLLNVPLYLPEGQEDSEIE